MPRVLKSVLFLFVVFCAPSLLAQQNPLLDRTFWKSKPGTAAVVAQVSKGADPSELTSNGFDATVLAINENADNKTIEYLLSQPGNPASKKTHDGRTYLFWAAAKGNLEIVELLIKKGAKTTVLDDHGYTSLNFAAANGQENTKIYDLLITKGANLSKDLDHNGANALLLAAATAKDLSLLQYFVEKGLNLKSTDDDGNTVIDYVARTGNRQLIDQLLAKGVKFGKSTVVMAARGTRSNTNPLEFYEYLETKGVDLKAVSADGENALHSVVRRDKDLSLSRYLLSKGVNINQTTKGGSTVLMMAAAANENPEMLRLLLENTKNVNDGDAKGETALSKAVERNSPEIVALLLQNGADATTVDADGNNLGYYLAQSFRAGKAEEFDAKLKYLQSKGLDLSKPQPNGDSMFHFAVAKNDPALLKRCLNLGIDINQKNSQGLTALHKAAMTSRNDELMRYLIEMGAKADIQTDFKETTYDLAAENEALKKNKISIEFLKS